jgi:hypothetical protein
VRRRKDSDADVRAFNPGWPREVAMNGDGHGNGARSATVSMHAGRIFGAFATVALRRRAALTLLLLVCVALFAGCDRATEDWQRCQQASSRGDAISACEAAVQKDAKSASGVAAGQRLVEIHAAIAKEQEKQRREDEEREAAEAARDAAQQALLAEARKNVALTQLPIDTGRCGATNDNGVGFSPVWRCGAIDTDEFRTGPLCNALAAEKGLVLSEQAARFPKEAGYFCKKGAHAE